jgi:hypothetical protein
MTRPSITIAGVLVFALALGTAAAKPESGTACAEPAKTNDTNLSRLTLGFMGNAVTIQEGTQLPIVAYYGEDTPYADGDTLRVVRANKYSLYSVLTRNGKLIWRETATASANGKHFIRVREQLGAEGLATTTFIYSRVGSAPTGDRFLGTWQQIEYKVYVVPSEPRGGTGLRAELGTLLKPISYLKR